MSKQNEPIYRVIFTQQGKSYEVYSKYISEESLMGFIEVDELIFSDSPSNIVVDPSEEKLKNEFKGVTRFYIPMHAVARIDEVMKEGPGSIKDLGEKGSNVSHFPKQFVPPKEK